MDFNHRAIWNTKKSSFCILIFRALQKKIRAEEMLRASSLPPSMARRETTKPKMDVCPRSYRDSFSDDNSSKKPKKIPNFHAYHDRFEKNLEDLKNEFISTSPRPFKLRTSKRVSVCNFLSIIILILISESKKLQKHFRCK